MVYILNFMWLQNDFLTPGFILCLPISSSVMIPQETVTDLVIVYKQTGMIAVKKERVNKKVNKWKINRRVKDQDAVNPEMFIIKKKKEMLKTQNKWICYQNAGSHIKLVITKFRAQGSFTKESLVNKINIVPRSRQIRNVIRVATNRILESEHFSEE